MYVPPTHLKKYYLVDIINSDPGNPLSICWEQQREHYWVHCVQDHTMGAWVLQPVLENRLLKPPLSSKIL